MNVKDAACMSSGRCSEASREHVSGLAVRPCWRNGADRRDPCVPRPACSRILPLKNTGGDVMTIARGRFSDCALGDGRCQRPTGAPDEHQTLEEAQVDITGELRESNYRIAALYQWNEAERVWREVDLFNSQEFPLRIH